MQSLGLGDCQGPCIYQLPRSEKSRKVSLLGLQEFFLALGTVWVQEVEPKGLSAQPAGL